jgi:hypothetical protein
MTDSTERDREIAAMYGDDIAAMPDGPAKELAILEYQLKVAVAQNENDRIDALVDEIGELRRAHPEVGD